MENQPKLFYAARSHATGSPVEGLRESGVTRGTRETSGVLVVKSRNNHFVQFVNSEFYKNLGCTLSIDMLCFNKKLKSRSSNFLVF